MSNDNTAAPQVLGHYIDGQQALFRDVVRSDPVAGLDMIVKGYTPGKFGNLMCEFRGNDSMTKQMQFRPSELHLIRRAQEPAEPANAIQAARPILQVTPAQVEAEIASEHYYTGTHGAAGVRHLESTPDVVIPKQLAGVMHCTLITKNGHIVTAEALCQDLRQQDPERAKQSARRRAFDKLYDMVVYEARSRCLATSK